jgi:hypothetical protein
MYLAHCDIFYGHVCLFQGLSRCELGHLPGGKVLQIF